MNHKGQVLVLFLLLLPILLLLTGLLIDTGWAYIEKRKIEHVMKQTILYALDHLDDEEETLKLKMKDLIHQNVKDLYDIRIEIRDQIIKLHIEKKLNTIFSSLHITEHQIKLSYKGKIIEEKKIIEKE